MPFSSPAQRTRGSEVSNISTFIGLSAVLVFFVISGLLSYWNTQSLRRNSVEVTHTHEIITSLDRLLALMKDAETGQRGYVITGDESYLAPYNNAVTQIERHFNHVTHLVRGNALHENLLKTMRPHIDAKLAELNRTIGLRRSEGFEATRKVVVTDRGKNEMDQIRNLISAIQEDGQKLREQRLIERAFAYRIALISGLIAAALGILLSVIVGLLMRRAVRTQRRQEWLQSGQLGLSKAVAGEQQLERLGDSILSFIAEYADAHAGAFYVQDGERYRRVATYGVPVHDASIPLHFTSGDTLLGQCVKDKRTIVMHEVPEGYLTIRCALGKSAPRHLAIAPGISDARVNAVIELGFMHGIDSLMQELLERAGETIGIAVRSANYRMELQAFLAETQRQSEELQTQSEELKVSNEELEEQSRALKESQTRLEQQQAELEQTNSQLEEQTQMLEHQRDQLSRANDDVVSKAQELERASQYKSDFLANMSHELRTPLNSSLILAKLLADNGEGNLTEDQIKYAKTIQSSGNDLLALINDILDLSKIEAGHMEIHAESMPISRLVNNITHLFEPLAEQRGLAFKTHIAADCVASIDTDRMRLEQVLKNLLANAIKFTESGSITLDIRREGKGHVAFSVIDTGIGIGQEHQQAIFDAFRQADGTISRRYGGTGLGLSISRELVRLLGGTISLTSEPGKGSSFTVLLPVAYDANAVMPATMAYHAPVSEPAPVAVVDEPVMASPSIPDDREHLSASKRMILVVEDDLSFARILYDLAHELGFQCLITTTAEEALLVARQYLPHAVVLDVNLPDHSGLSVLDRLKRDARTRHIPVHVVSVDDYAKTARELGAVGYMFKPIKRDELADALKQMEARFEQGVRRVLIVEDDAVQRDSVCKLLSSSNVQTVAVGSAAECMEHLKTTSFDCMVLDLSLPDASGYELLETLSKQEDYAFPPVIVYTGRDLSSKEEQKLRRYSKSIIIKGAKSPERLLDEVTLFLHQVVAELPPEQQRMIEKAHNRDAILEGRRILVVEDDVRNVYALTSIFEPHGAHVQIARNGKEALTMIEASYEPSGKKIDLVLMDVMMPEMDGLTATRHIRQRKEWRKLPVIMLTAKAMRGDQARCMDAGANDYMAKPLDVEKLLSLVRVWMPR